MSSQLMPPAPAQVIVDANWDEWVEKYSGLPIVPIQVEFRFTYPTLFGCGCSGTRFTCTFNSAGILTHNRCPRQIEVHRKYFNRPQAN